MCLCLSDKQTRTGMTDKSTAFVKENCYNTLLIWIFQKEVIMYFVDRTAVVLKPTEAFLSWLKSTDADMPDLTLSQIRSNCTVYLVPDTEEPEEVIAFFNERFQNIFETEIAGWEIEKHLWPEDMNLELFWKFFEVEVHDIVLDMVDAEIKVSPVVENLMM